MVQREMEKGNRGIVTNGGQSNDKKREKYTAEEKVNILKEHLANGVPILDICDQHQLQPSVFYRWHRQLFEQRAAAFENDEKREVAQLKKKMEQLESKVATKNEVLGELMEAHIALKSLGEE